MWEIDSQPVPGWVKKFLQESANNPNCCQNSRIFSTNLHKAQWQKITPIKLIELGDIKLVLKYSLPSYNLVSLVQENAL